MAKKHNDPLRVPPQTLESEKALLGALMIRPDGMTESSDLISPDAFYSEKHRIIYRAMLALYTKSEPVDIESVRAKLSDEGVLEQVGGIGYLAELVSNVPAASSARRSLASRSTSFCSRSRSARRSCI